MIRNILIVGREGSSLSSLLRALLKREIKNDPILVEAGIKVDSADISFHGPELKASQPFSTKVKSSLAKSGLDISEISPESPLRSGILQWADLILVPGLGEEDLLCISDRATWSKIEGINTFCSRLNNIELSVPPGMVDNEEIFLSAVVTFKELLPDLINRIKDSYAGARIIKGIGMNRKTIFSNTVVTGYASVARSGYDLLKFTKGNILVTDRLGAVISKDIEKDLALKIIKKFKKSPIVCEDELTEIEDKLKDFENKMKGLKTETNRPKISPSANNAINVIVENASGLICSRGYHVDEIHQSHYLLPYISSCPGITNMIKDNQFIAMDTGRGEVYDVELLCKMATANSRI